MWVLALWDLGPVAGSLAALTPEIGAVAWK